MDKLKYISFDIVFQEVPDETTLALNITNCPYHCKGCHSKHLWKDIGKYIDDDIEDIINQYKNMITCVCFMGGDQCRNNLIYWLNIIKNKYNLKTCLYTGNESIENFNDIIKYLDYIKIGSYKKEFGGLNHKTTNQKFYKIKNSKLFDRTYLFQEKHHM